MHFKQSRVRCRRSRRRRRRRRWRQPSAHLHFVPLLAVRLAEAVQHQVAVDDARGEQALGVNVHVLRGAPEQLSACFIVYWSLSEHMQHARTIGWSSSCKVCSRTFSIAPQTDCNSAWTAARAAEIWSNDPKPTLQPPPLLPPPAWMRRPC